MPIYKYQCVDCGTTDKRIAGLDDHVALCVECGGLMLRLDEDVFLNVFDGQEKAQCSKS
jgi:putative FmdB family regulatory protein